MSDTEELINDAILLFDTKENIEEYLSGKESESVAIFKKVLLTDPENETALKWIQYHSDIISEQVEKIRLKQIKDRGDVFTNFIAFHGRVSDPPDLDMYWFLTVDENSNNLGFIANQNGYKQFLYRLFDINTIYSRLTSVNNVSKKVLLQNRLSTCRSEKYPLRYPCLVNAWEHFESVDVEFAFIYDLNIIKDTLTKKDFKEEYEDFRSRFNWVQSNECSESNVRIPHENRW